MTSLEDSIERGEIDQCHDTTENGLGSASEYLDQKVCGDGAFDREEAPQAA